MPRPMARSVDLDDPNPELGRFEHAIIFIALCGMASFLVREAVRWVRSSKKIRRLQSEVESAIARGEADAAEHSD